MGELEKKVGENALSNALFPVNMRTEEGIALAKAMVPHIETILSSRYNPKKFIEKVISQRKSARRKCNIGFWVGVGLSVTCVASTIYSLIEPSKGLPYTVGASLPTTVLSMLLGVKSLEYRDSIKYAEKVLSYIE